MTRAHADEWRRRHLESSLKYGTCGNCAVALALQESMPQHAESVSVAAWSARVDGKRYELPQELGEHIKLFDQYAEGDPADLSFLPRTYVIEEYPDER